MPPRKGSQAAGVLWWKQHKNDPDIEAIEARIAAEEEEHQNERTKQERMMNEWYNEQTPGTRQAYDYEQSRTQHERAGVALYTDNEQPKLDHSRAHAAPQPPHAHPRNPRARASCAVGTTAKRVGYNALWALVDKAAQDSLNLNGI